LAGPGIGIIGLGVGRTYALSARSLGFGKLVLCDTDDEPLDAVASEVAADAAVSTFEEVVADPDLDAVVVAVPDPLHRQMTVSALRAGKHVLCETPLALRRSEAELVLDAAYETGLHVMVAHRLRFHPLVQRMRRELGRVGEIGLVEVRWLRPSTSAPSGWRLDPAHKRHLAIGEAVDFVDGLRWLGGELFEVVGFATRRFHPDWPFGDTVVAAGRFVNRAGLHSVFSIGGDTPNVTWLAAHGTEGSLVLDLEAGELAFQSRDGWKLLEATGTPYDDSGLEEAVLRSFLELLEDGRKNPCPVEEAAAAVVCAIAFGDAADVNLPARIRPFRVE